MPPFDAETIKLIMAFFGIVGAMVGVAKMAVGALAKHVTSLQESQGEVMEKVLGQNAAREIAVREQADRVMETQQAQAERLATILENHMTVISANQAKTAQSLDLIVERLLPAKKVKRASP